MNRVPENTYTVYYNPYMFGAGAYSTLRTSQIINCVIANNEARVLNWNTANTPSTVVIRGGGLANENGGTIINNTIVNNRATVFDLSGNVLTTASSAGQGAGLFIQNGNASTSYDNYVVNNVFWGNTAPGTSSSYQSVRLTVNTSAVTPQPLVQYSNNVTTEAISISATTSPYYAETNKYIDLATSNAAATKVALFKNPTTFSGAVWGNITQASADSLSAIAKANWSVQSGSYLLAKGTTSYNAPTIDIVGISRSANPTLGAYEGLIYNASTAVNELNQPVIYRSGNTLYNLEAGDAISIFDCCGRKLEAFTSSGNTAKIKSTGFVIIEINRNSSVRFCLK